MNTKSRRLLLLAPLIMLMTFLGTVFTPWLTSIVGADLAYTYTDTNYSGVTGPNPQTNSGTLNFTKGSAGNGTYTASGSNPVGSGNCTYTIVTSDKKYDGANSGTIDGGQCPGVGKLGPPQNITIGKPSNSGSSGSTTSTTDSSTSSTSGPDINCGGISLNWILCPFEEGLTTAVRGIDAIINGLLQIDTNSIFSNCPDATSSTNCTTSAAYKSAWSGMRTIALALLVLAALVMIISQALGFEFVDAYTIRKVLPRLIAAAIGITLSWQLLQFFVTFTNDLGLGVRNLIYSPFSGLPQSIALGNAGGFLGIILGVVGAVFLGWGMLSFIATALLAVFIAILVLVIRQVLIIFLILIAPLAIVSYILPNTKKMYDIWWDFFAKALLMFPFIMAFIAVGRVFASVAATNATAPGVTGAVKAIDGVLAFVAYFAPYFLLPLTFKFAGGALRNIGGFVNDRGRGGFDRLRKYRANTAAERFKRAQSQSLWDNNSRIGRQANKLASWGTSPVANTAYYGRNIPGLKKRGYGVAASIDRAKVEQSSKLFEEINKMGYNDKAYRALTGQWSDEQRSAFNAVGVTKPPTSLADLQKVATAMKGLGGTDAIGGTAIEGSLGRLASLYQDPEMTKANIQAAGIMGLSAHGFADGNDLAGTGNFLRASGGAGFAQSVISQAQLLGQRSRPDIKAGYGVTIDKDGVFKNGMLDGRMSNVLDTFSAQDLAGAKGGAIEAVKPEILRRLDGSKGEQFQRAQRDQLFSWAGPYSQASADVKARALDIIYEKGADDSYTRPDLVQQFQDYTRQDMAGNPNRLPGPGPEPDQQPPPGGG